MPQYGEVRVDFITYTTGVAPNEGNVTVPISGLINAPTFSGDVVIEGDLTVSGLSTFSGITVTGDATIGGDLTVSGNINASGVTISGITGLFASGTEAAPSITFTGDTNTGLYSPGADQVAITTGGTGRLFVDGSGNVGIGTSSPDAPLSFGKNVYGEPGSEDFYRIKFSNFGGTNNDVGIGQSAGKNLDFNGQEGFRFLLGTSGEAARITADGNVGIGTTSPSSSLEVDGFIQSSNGLKFSDTDSQYGLFPLGTQTLAFNINSSEKLRINAAGNVGIGTTSPGQILEIASASNPQMRFTDTGAYYYDIGITSSNKFTIAPASTPALTVVAAGNVGIGTTDPSSKLTVSDTSGTGFKYLLDMLAPSAGQNPIMRFISRNAANTATTSVDFYKVYQGGFTIGNNDTAASNYTSFNVGASERLRITSAGNVGIGTSNPGSSLEISNSNPAFAITDTDTANTTFRVRNASGTVYLDSEFNNGNGVIAFTRNGESVESARIDSSGNVGIGTSNPNSLLHLSSNSPRITLTDTNTGADHRINADSSVGNFAIDVDVNSETTSPSLVCNIKGGEKMRIASSGNVGIGTTDPSQKLAVSGGNILLDSNNQLRFGTSDAAFIEASGSEGSGGTRYMRFGVNSEMMRIDSAGNVGIGTTSPQNKLSILQSEVADAPTRSSALYLQNNGNCEIQMVGKSINDCQIRFGTSNNSFKGAFEYQLDVDDLVLYTSGSEAMRIDSSGRLLVGTSSSITTLVPAGLQVQGTGADAYASLGRWSANTSNPGLIFNKSRGASVGTRAIVQDDDNLGELSFTGDDGSAYIYAARIQAQVDGTPGANDMPGRLVFSTTASGASNPTERMSITNEGYIFPDSASRSQKASIASTANQGFRALAAASTTGVRYEGFTTSTGTAYHIAFSNPNGIVGSISTNASATAYNTSSDYRLKENVVDLTGAIDRVNQLQVHRFNFIADPDTTVDGFLAHEAQDVIPECVTGTKDEVDDEGNPVYQGIDQSKIVPLLTAALQEALAKIESLESRLAALENS